MADPIEVACMADAWNLVATAVTSAQIFMGGLAAAGPPPRHWRMTYRQTGGAIPVNDIGVVAATLDRDGAQSSYRAEHGEPVDIYLYPVGGAGVATIHEPVGLMSTVAPIVVAKCQGLDAKTDEMDVAGVLNGNVAKKFTPTHAIITVTATAGALNEDGTINVGTAADADNILAAVALTGLNTVGDARQVPIPTAVALNILGNATLHANVESAETGAGTLDLEVAIVGPQI